MTKRIVLLILALTPFVVSAQSDELGVDLSVEVQKKINKQLSISLEAEYRNRNDLKTNDRWSAGVEVSYKVAKWLKASAGYTFLYDNNERTSYYDATDDAVFDGDVDEGDPKKYAQYWGSRHRFNVSLTASKKFFGDFKFSLRERWQYTYRPEYTVDERWSFLKQAYDGKEHTYSAKGKNVLRSRLQIEYDKKGLALKPYVSTEFFNAWSLQKTRYTIGADYDINKQHSVGAFYRYQHVRSDDDDNEPDSHLIGVSYQFKF